MIIQGRNLTPEDIQWISHLMSEHPDWHRSRLSQEICIAWNWVNALGQLKDMASRTMLLKLERLGYLRLPQPRNVRGSVPIRIAIPHSTAEIVCSLRDLAPIYIRLVEDKDTSRLYKHLLDKYHYLGFSGAVGENMKYFVCDRLHRPLACLLFGAAAWKVACRDEWIAWSPETRKAGLHLLTNNMRFLILPWVRAPHLASHLLGKIVRRISNDWVRKYGHPIHLLETFVEQDRFRGTCYQAANWIRVGQTKGRSRNDTAHTLQVPVKSVYLYPLGTQVREVLTREA